MSDQNTSWFHCGRCGTLFLSPVGEAEDRLCTKCGNSPSLGLESQAAPLPLPKATIPQPREAPAPEREKHSHRKRKKSTLMLKLIIAWVMLIGLIIWGAQALLHREPTDAHLANTEEAADVLSEEDFNLLEDAASISSRLLTSFLGAESPEQRNQFVYSPVRTSPRMARFQTMNQLPRVNPASLVIKGKSVVHIPDLKVIEVQLQEGDGKLLDSVFIKENEEWKIDWEHFVRYGDVPWALYLAGSGEDVSEFRLLARERLAEERKDAPDISVILYAPRFGAANETGTASPEFLIPRNSENGRKLEAAFKLERSGKQPFGVKLPSINPEGLIRVRVKVRRVVEGMERRFELEDVIVCHWYSTDEPGMDISGASAGK